MNDVSRPSPNAGCWTLLAIAGAVMAVLVGVALNGGDLLGVALGTSSAPSPAPAQSFAVGALPTVGPESSGTTATTAAPETVPPTAAPAVTQAPQQPAQTNPPQTQPPLQCGLPGSITVFGGDTGSLGGSGGTFKVTSAPATLQTAGLVNCGQHYRLAWSGSGSGTSSGQDCQLGGFNTQINSAVGQTVTVTLQLPPNSCG